MCCHDPCGQEGTHTLLGFGCWRVEKFLLLSRRFYPSGSRLRGVAAVARFVLAGMHACTWARVRRGRGCLSEKPLLVPRTVL